MLEYIVKHGSERVIDDARAHLGTIKILRNFHYIDEAGKDQGLNVRNRAKELAELLSDVDRIRQERRKARANRQKYQGSGNSDFVPGSGGGRYGGFGSDSFYAGGGGFSGASASTAGRYPSGGDGARESFDEYDAGDDDAAPASARAGRSSSSSRKPASSGTTSKQKQPQQAVADLFSFDDDETAAPAPAAASSAAADALGDDFDDFQAAPTAATSKPASSVTPSAGSKTKSTPNVFDFLDDNGSSTLNSSNTALRPSNAGAGGAQVLSPPLRPAMTSASSAASLPSSSGALTPQSRATATKPQTQQQPAKQSSGLSGFDDLWSSSSGSSSKAAGSGKKTMADLAKEQSGQGVWGSSSTAAKPANGASNGGQKKDLFDLL